MFIYKKKNEIAILSNDTEFKNTKYKRTCLDGKLKEYLNKWLLQAKALEESFSGPIL